MNLSPCGITHRTYPGIIPMPTSWQNHAYPEWKHCPFYWQHFPEYWIQNGDSCWKVILFIIGDFSHSIHYFSVLCQGWSCTCGRTNVLPSPKPRSVSSCPDSWVLDGFHELLSGQICWCWTSAWTCPFDCGGWCLKWCNCWFQEWAVFCNEYSRKSLFQD